MGVSTGYIGLSFRTARACEERPISAATCPKRTVCSQPSQDGRLAVCSGVGFWPEADRPISSINRGIWPFVQFAGRRQLSTHRAQEEASSFSNPVGAIAALRSALEHCPARLRQARFASSANWAVPGEVVRTFVKPMLCGPGFAEKLQPGAVLALQSGQLGFSALFGYLPCLSRR